MSLSQYPITPKDPEGPLRVLLLGRISTEHQNIENIEASFAIAERYLRESYSGDVFIKELGERGSGMLTSRASIIEAEEDIATRTWDLVLMEDLSRAYRNPRHQYEFVQDAFDAQTRVICIGDNLDTADPQWEVMMTTATIRHGLHIPDTRRRVRRTADHSFQQGGMVTSLHYGYLKVSKVDADAGTYGAIGLRLRKDPQATAIIQKIGQLILDGHQYESIAEWLNVEQIPVGPRNKSGIWSSQNVRDLMRDPLLSGTRRFRVMKYVPQYKTGQHRREKNQKPEIQILPELAHLSEAEHAAVLACMDERIRLSRSNNHKKGRENPRYGLSPTKGIWPAKHAQCGICGGRMERTFQDQLKCQNAFKKGTEECWNHVQVKAEVVRQQLLPRLWQQLEAVPDFRETLIESAWAAYSVRTSKLSRRSDDLQTQIAQLQKSQANIVKAISRGVESEELFAELQRVEADLKRLRDNLNLAEQQSQQQGFRNREEFADAAVAALLETARTSFDFTNLMLKTGGTLVIQPVQGRDSTQVYPRARLVLEFAGKSVGDSPVQLTLEADCFEPSVQVRLLDACRIARDAHPGWGCRRLSTVLNAPYMTVKRSLRYLKIMEELGVTDPYLVLHERPESAARWKKRTPRPSVQASLPGRTLDGKAR